jgi:hypothetical protein
MAILTKPQVNYMVTPLNRRSVEVYPNISYAEIIKRKGVTNYEKPNIRYDDFKFTKTTRNDAT